jgi:hypothetical protein
MAHSRRNLRVLYIVQFFPQVSETYIKTEIDALVSDYDIKIVSLETPNLSYDSPHEYFYENREDRFSEMIRQFKPDILHTHWVYTVKTVGKLSQKHSIPFTVRSHSFDVLGKTTSHIVEALKYLNSSLCLGVLAFPVGMGILSSIGVTPSKLIECFPVINFSRFYDPSPNGKAVMNMGACLDKKKFENYIDLAHKMPEKTFNLYAIGYNEEKLQEYNRKRGGRVNFVPIVHPEVMLAEYKKHEWMVYTARFSPATVGLPMAVAEAQAAGVGVCMANIRPDLANYVGDAGYLYNSIEEVQEIIAHSFSQERRELGFSLAKRSDIERHKHLLTDLWNNVHN